MRDIPDSVDLLTHHLLDSSSHSDGIVLFENILMLSFWSQWTIDNMLTQENDGFSTGYRILLIWWILAILSVGLKGKA